MGRISCIRNSHAATGSNWEFHSCSKNVFSKTSLLTSYPSTFYMNINSVTLKLTIVFSIITFQILIWKASKLIMCVLFLHTIFFKFSKRKGSCEPSGSINGGEFHDWVTVSFSRRILLHGVSSYEVGGICIHTEGTIIAYKCWLKILTSCFIYQCFFTCIVFWLESWKGREHRRPRHR
jgi:hypothetical protein